MADLNGDGHLDLVSGCFEGGVYLVAGDGEGGFAAPVAILDEDGDPLRVGQYWDYETEQWTGAPKSAFADTLGISATPVDWDADGDLDLVLGTFQGTVFLRENVSEDDVPVFAAGDVQVELANGDELLVSGRHSMPVAADWDGDGLWDLISGSGAGGVSWWRNVGEEGEPAFAPEEVLVAPPVEDAPTEASTAAGAVRLGERTQVHVVDFDADGDLDLLIGDNRHELRGEQRTFHGFVWLVRRDSAPPGDG